MDEFSLSMSKISWGQTILKRLTFLIKQKKKYHLKNEQHSVTRTSLLGLRTTIPISCCKEMPSLVYCVFINDTHFRGLHFDFDRSKEFIIQNGLPRNAVWLIYRAAESVGRDTLDTTTLILKMQINMHTQAFFLILYILIQRQIGGKLYTLICKQETVPVIKRGS